MTPGILPGLTLFVRFSAGQVVVSRAVRQSMSIIFRLISAAALDSLLPPFVELLREAVNGGAALGFLPPLTHDESRDYWLSLSPELHAGSRLLLAAFTGGRLVGSGQLRIPPWTNGRHRVEIEKVFVAPAMRGRGVGRSLMAALHDTARQRGRSLVLLNARRGGPAEGFYKRLGYREVGVVPGFSAGPAGERYDNVSFYQELPYEDAGSSIAGATALDHPLQRTRFVRG